MSGRGDVPGPRPPRRPIHAEAGPDPCGTTETGHSQVGARVGPSPGGIDADPLRASSVTTACACDVALYATRCGHGRLCSRHNRCAPSAGRVGHASMRRSRRMSAPHRLVATAGRGLGHGCDPSEGPIAPAAKNPLTVIGLGIEAFSERRSTALPRRSDMRIAGSRHGTSGHLPGLPEPAAPNGWRAPVRSLMARGASASSLTVQDLHPFGGGPNRRRRRRVIQQTHVLPPISLACRMVAVRVRKLVASSRICTPPHRPIRTRRAGGTSARGVRDRHPVLPRVNHRRTSAIGKAGRTP